MWDDFQIGEPTRICAARNISGYNLAQNDQEYWWISSEYDIGGKISKSSDVGQALSHMISDRSDPDKVEALILRTALNEIGPDTIEKILRSVKQKAYAAGRSDKETEFRSCLGL